MVTIFNLKFLVLNHKVLLLVPIFVSDGSTSSIVTEDVIVTIIIINLSLVYR